MHWTAAGLAVAAALGCGSSRLGHHRPAPAGPVVTLDDALWMADRSGKLLAFNLNDRPVATVDIGQSASGWQLTGGGNVVWAYSDDGRLVRIDTQAPRVAARLSLPAVKGPAELFSIGSTVWINRSDGLWHAGDSGGPTRVDLPTGVTLARVAGDSLGLSASTPDGQLLKVDPATGHATVVGRNPALTGIGAFVLAGNAVYAASTSTLSVLDGTTAATVRSFPLSASKDVSVYPALLATKAASGQHLQQFIWAVLDHRTLVQVEPPGGPSIPLPDLDSTTPVVEAGDQLWIGDAHRWKLIRIPFDNPAVNLIDLPRPSAPPGPDVALAVYIGPGDVWVVEHDNTATGAMSMWPRVSGYQMELTVPPRADLSPAAVPASIPRT